MMISSKRQVEGLAFFVTRTQEKKKQRDREKRVSPLSHSPLSTKRDREKKKKRTHRPAELVKRKEKNKKKKGGRDMGKRAALQLTPEQLSEEVDAYFLHCESTREVRELKNGDIKIRQQWPSMPALALWLGISKESICAYARGEYPAEWINHIPDGEEHPLKVYKDNVSEVTKLYAQELTRARLRIETTIVQAAASGDMDSKTASLLLNQFGYFSKQEVEQTGDLRVKWQGVDAPEADRYSK